MLFNKPGNMIALKIAAIALVFLITSCNNSARDAAVDQAEAINEATKMGPAQVQVSSDGYHMSATINGKEWKATSMLDPSASAKIIGYTGQKYVSLPYNSNPSSGKKIKLSNDNQVDLNLSFAPSINSTESGEIEITSVEGGWVEGTFHCTLKEANGSKVTEITDGKFRLPALK